MVELQAAVRKGSSPMASVQKRMITNTPSMAPGATVTGQRHRM